jgi:outer membrane biosynthesis protein TonB
MSCRRAAGRKALTLCLFLFALISAVTAVAGELEQRFADALQRAEQGDVSAMYNVGEMYELGMGTKTDRSKSMTWYRRAADKGHPEGAYQVGYAYYWGKAGLDKDRRQAHIWFLRAAEGGSHAAMPYLAKMYSLGQGVPRDKEKAALWSARAAAGPSALHSQPPAPEVTRRPEPPPPAAKPKPARKVVRKVAEPAPKPVQETPPAAKPVADAKPKSRSKPKPKPNPRPAPKVDRKKQQMERLLASWWQKDQRPALYLPSSQTDCSISEEVILCQSKPHRSSLLGRPYSYRFRSNMKAFDRLGRFTLRYWPDVTDILPIPPGGYATGDDVPEPPSDEEIRMRVERPAEEMSCEMFKDTHLTCTDSKGGSHEFKRLDRHQSAVPAAQPPAPSTAAATAGDTSPESVETPPLSPQNQTAEVIPAENNGAGSRSGASAPPVGRR